MSRKEFDKELRTRALPTIEAALKDLDEHNPNTHVIALSIFTKCLETVTVQWNTSWLLGPPDNVSNEEYALQTRMRAQLYVRYLCRCDETLAAEIVQDVVSKT